MRGQFNQFSRRVLPVSSLTVNYLQSTCNLLRSLLPTRRNQCLPYALKAQVCSACWTNVHRLLLCLMPYESGNRAIEEVRTVTWCTTKQRSIIYLYQHLFLFANNVCFVCDQNSIFRPNTLRPSFVCLPQNFMSSSLQPYCSIEREREPNEDAPLRSCDPVAAITHCNTHLAVLAAVPIGALMRWPGKPWLKIERSLACRECITKFALRKTGSTVQPLPIQANKAYKVKTSFCLLVCSLSVSLLFGCSCWAFCSSLLSIRNIFSKDSLRAF